MRIATPIRRGARALFLIQALVYLVVLAAIGYLAFNAFFSLKTGARRAQMVADDIVSTMHAGELWREDVRAADGPVELRVADGDVELVIPQAEARSVRYRFSSARIRRTDAAGRETDVLKDVADTRFVREPRKRVTAWRWELTLKPNGPNLRMKPLFTFIAVPAHQHP